MGVRDVVVTQLGNATNYAQNQADRIVSPATRQQKRDELEGFARARPLVATFLLTFTLLSALPLTLFTTFALTILTTTLLAAIAFSLFWISIAFFCLLFPTLLVAAGISVVAWSWGWVGFMVCRTVYEMVVPPHQRGVLYERIAAGPGADVGRRGKKGIDPRGLYGDKDDVLKAGANGGYKKKVEEGEEVKVGNAVMEPVVGVEEKREIGVVS